jgi:hypothetical protein
MMKLEGESENRNEKIFFVMVRASVGVMKDNRVVLD